MSSKPIEGRVSRSDILCRDHPYSFHDLSTVYGRVCPGRPHHRPRNPSRRCRYRFTLFLTSALDGVGGQRQAPVALLPGKTRYPFYGWVSELVWTGAENLASTGIRSPYRPARSESLYRLSYPDSPHTGLLCVLSCW